MIAQLLHILPMLFGGAVCLYALHKFWTGLSLRPHAEGHKAPRDRFIPFFFWSS